MGPEAGLDRVVDAQSLRLDGVSPALGPTTGRFKLSLSGQGFTSNTTVRIDGVPATEVTVRSGTLLTATLPARLGRAGKVSVSVHNSDGETATRADLFRYRLTQLPFPEPVFTYGGGTPRAIALIDLNGDDQLDIATLTVGGGGGGGENSVVLLLSNGEGGFTHSPRFVIETNPVALATGDLNADRRPDLVVANAGSNSVSLLLGDGHGLLAASSFPAGNSPSAIAVGDFNQDHYPDVVVANSGSGNISMLINNGRGGLAAPVHVAVGAAPSAVAAGDFNRDGKLDVAVTNKTGNELRVLLGNGLGGFLALGAIAVGTAPSALAAADLDGDGAIDLAVLNAVSTSVSVLRGDGAGGFALASPIPVGPKPASLVISDVNEDSRPDLVIAHTGSRIGILYGDGQGGFGAISYQPNWMTNTGSAVAVGDMDGDQRVDLVTSDPSPRILRNNGQGGFGGAPEPLPAGLTDVGRPAVGDFNADGKPDLAVISQAMGTVSVMLGDGAGGFSPPRIFAVGKTPSFPVVGDWNGDSWEDLAVPNFDDRTVSILLGDGKGAFSAPAGSGTGFPVGFQPLALTAGDWNGDQKPDLVVAGSGVDLFVGDGTGTFRASPQGLSLGLGHFESLVTADFNGDGKQDFAAAEHLEDSGRAVYMNLGNGQLGFSSVRIPSLPSQTAPSSLVAADLNADRRVDLVVGSLNFGGFVLLGTGDGGFRNAIAITPGTSRLEGRYVLVGDWNADGKQDVLIGTLPLVVIHWGDGLGGFTAATGSWGNGYGVVADFNNDQKLDLVTVAGGVRVYLNTSP